MGGAGKIVIMTERMVLRRFTGSDVDVLYELDGDPEVMRYLGRVRTSQEFIQSSLIPNLLQEYRHSSYLGSWAAVVKATNEFIGWFSLRAGEQGTKADLELGYRLRRSSWGQGFATEGGRALIDRAFRDPETERIRAQTMAVNVGSRRIMEKCGMIYLRTFHQHFDDPLLGTQHGELNMRSTASSG